MAADAAPRAVRDRQQAVADLESALAGTPRAARPYEHATLAYRLGLAYAESGIAGPTESLRKALACYDVAAAVFDRKLDPVEHARVLNAAGAAHRGLGHAAQAAALFEQAASLLDGLGRDDERAAALNNLGLVRSELGDAAAAITACDQAIPLFDASNDDGRRARAAAFHTRGSARAASTDRQSFEAALADYQAAATEIDGVEAPYHHALISHSMGVVWNALAAAGGPDDAEREANLHRAVSALNESLAVFVRSDFPFQHALAKFNLGVCLAGLGGADNLRRALVCFEDAVSVLDPRLHADAWKRSYERLASTEEQLAAAGVAGTRAEQYVALLVASDERERMGLLRERLTRVLELPDATRHLSQLAIAAASLGEDGCFTVLTAALDVLMELPTEHLEIALRCIVETHRLLGDGQEEADRALDRAVSDALVGPQRVFVRDFLISLDWERP